MPPTNFENERWFSEHVLPHEPMLRAWLRRRFGAQVDIDDVVQETYVRILQIRGGDALVSPKAFVFATARNVALDQLRRHGHSRTDFLGEFGELNVLDEHDSIPDTVARNQELALLAEAIQALPRRCRQIFTLRKLYGLSQREIAAQLGISESTVSNQITIGIEKCTEFLSVRCEGHLPET